MKTFLKIIAGFLALVILIAVGLNLYFTDERLKSTIMPYVNDFVGRPVQVDAISLTFFSTFPQPGISIENLSIPAKTEGDTLLSLDELTASVELFSLFRDQINISEISLQNPQFTYVVHPDGSTNIDFLMQGEEAAQDTSAGYAINIPSFQVSGGDFGYRDATSNTRIQINDLDADISLSYADLIKSTIDLEIGGVKAVADSTIYLNGLPLSLSQQSTINLENETITFDKGTFSIRGLALNLTGSIANWSTTTTVDLRFNSSSDNFGELLRLIPEKFKESVENLETRGSLAIEGSITGAVGGEKLPNFDMLIKVTDGFVKYPDLPEAIHDIQLSMRATNDEIAIEQLTAQAAGNTFSAEGSVINPLNENQRSIDMHADLEFDLATINQFYPIDEDTLTMRGMLTASVNLKGQAEQIAEAVESGSITLSNGFIDHKSLGKPIQDITLQSSLDGAVLTIAEASFETGDNQLSVEGNITDYLSESRRVDIQVNGQANLSQISNYYELKPAVTELNGMADLSLHVSGPPAEPARLKFNGRMAVQNVNMKGEALVQPVTDLDGELSLTPSTAKLKTLNFKIGSSDITLNGSLSDYMAYLKAEENRDVTPHLEGSYKSELLNLDELINWQDTSSAPVPINLPDLTSSVTAEIGTLIVTGVEMNNLKAQTSTTPREINLEQALIELFGGTAKGSFVWEVPRPDHTMITFKGSLDGLEASAFFKEYKILGESSDFHKYISGAFSANVDYYSELDEYLNPLIKTSEMEGSFGMTKARLKGHPLQVKIAEFLGIPELKNAVLDKWQSTFTLDNSVLTFKNLELTSGDIGLGLSGTQHLIKGTINYQAKIFLPGQFKDDIASVITKQAADALTRENGTVMVPIRITGTNKNPVIRPDMEVIKPIIKDYLKNKAVDLLDNLFGG
ncbi:MAG TPA: AsmA-like C-terminal region-containing protein [Balneolaceae bacterium]|nr:AsmA-like C-terminal region-containing protein [Balneolaceae bacterium]